MVWEENSRICLHMQLIAILSRIGVNNNTSFKDHIYTIDGKRIDNVKETPHGLYIKGGKAYIKK